MFKGMKKVVVPVAISMVISMPCFCVHAKDNESLLNEKNQNAENLKDYSKKNEIKDKASHNQKFDIQSTAYSTFEESLKNFQGLQNQYGQLNESNNASAGFKAYLKNISEDKKNQQVQAKIHLIAQGDYQIPVTNKNIDALKDGLNNKENERNDSVSRDSQEKINQEEFNSDSMFGNVFQSSNQNQISQFLDKKDKNQQLANDIKQKGDENQTNWNVSYDSLKKLIANGMILTESLNNTAESYNQKVSTIVSSIQKQSQYPSAKEFYKIFEGK